MKEIVLNRILRFSLVEQKIVSFMSVSAAEEAACSFQCKQLEKKQTRRRLFSKKIRNSGVSGDFMMLRAQFEQKGKHDD